ncbi:hypothetical protein [Ruegeria arenilitoris]|uniref:hypothetical protein n=1 Tax=Ruegeria arenilitoris TaxID=1173585 RepID=UPI001479AA95|nr:hypothetical protein [Ruegeria arenilitoris]
MNTPNHRYSRQMRLLLLELFKYAESDVALAARDLADIYAGNEYDEEYSQDRKEITRKTKRALRTLEQRGDIELSYDFPVMTPPKPDMSRKVLVARLTPQGKETAAPFAREWTAHLEAIRAERSARATSVSPKGASLPSELFEVLQEKLKGSTPAQKAEIIGPMIELTAQLLEEVGQDCENINHAIYWLRYEMQCREDDAAGRERAEFLIGD